MIILKVYDDTLILCVDDKVVLYNINTTATRLINLPEVNVSEELTENQKTALKKEKQTVLTACFSNCGKYFAVCTLNKQLILYDREFNVLKNTNVCRGVSKVRFTPKGDIVIADKTGDAYLLELNMLKEKSNAEEGGLKEILGHLSMLLDVVVSDDEKYIITCDRDEKIRVSSYPNCYNIVSYCLGHSEYVSNVEFFDENILISASGDGTLKFWKYLTGEEILSINTNENIAERSLIENFISFMDNETVEVKALPITDMKVARMVNNNLFIIISLHSYDGLQIYKATETVKVQLWQIIHVHSKVISLDLTKNTLFILTENKLVAYEFENDCFELKKSDSLSDFFTKYTYLIHENLDKDYISILYKRKYDNVQEYQEKKKLRIENQKKE